MQELQTGAEAEAMAERCLLACPMALPACLYDPVLPAQRWLVHVNY